eukprot:COSAG01_NODE_16710_length_1212_cov_2.854447_1_plen_80_part_10
MLPLAAVAGWLAGWNRCCRLKDVAGSRRAISCFANRTLPTSEACSKGALVTGVGPSVESGSVENIGLAVARRLLLEGALV